MTEAYCRSLTEVNLVLSYMDSSLVERIPESLINFIKRNRDVAYMPNITKEVPINEQPLSKDAKILLSLIYRDYWCDEELKNILKREDAIAKKEYERERREKYNSDNIFKNSKSSQTVENIQLENVAQEIQMTEYKESIFKKIINKILNFFRFNR